MAHTASLQIHTVRQESRVTSVLAALLPPPVMFFALAFVFASVFGVPLYVPALLCGAAASSLAAIAPARRSRILLPAAMALSLGATAFSSVRDGVLLLANRLYEASEAVNAYAYDYFEVADSASPLAALVWLSLFGGLLCAFSARRRIVALVLFLAAALTEAFFGVTPPAWQNLLLFAVLALLLARESAANSLALLAGAAAVTLAVFLLAPRPNAAVEAYSEHLRDELGAVAMSLTQNGQQQESETNRTHQESRQHEELVGEDRLQGQEQRSFEREIENEQELSLPHRVDWLRIALWLLLVVALLVVPFLPFLLLNRARRRAEERRAAFSGADNAVAIRAMFAHTMDWLRAGGLDTENRPFAACVDAVEALTSPDLAARYAAAVSIWQEAAYSDHTMTAEQRQTVRELLDTTAATLYEKADARTKFRMKYIECLCGS